MYEIERLHKEICFIENAVHDFISGVNHGHISYRSLGFLFTLL